MRYRKFKKILKRYWKHQRKISCRKQNAVRKALHNFSWENLKKLTPAEIRFGELLDKIGIAYLKQPYSYSLGYAYIPDFVLEAPYFVVFEVDGGYHLTMQQREKDKRRDRHFSLKGYAVKRFTNEDVLENPQKTIDALIQLLNYRKRLNYGCKAKRIFYGGQARVIKPTKPIACSAEQGSGAEITD